MTAPIRNQGGTPLQKRLFREGGCIIASVEQKRCLPALPGAHPTTFPLFPRCSGRWREKRSEVSKAAAASTFYPFKGLEAFELGTMYPSRRKLAMAHSGNSRQNRVKTILFQ
jgi:hypothetical protein